MVKGTCSSFFTHARNKLVLADEYQRYTLDSVSVHEDSKNSLSTGGLLYSRPLSIGQPPPCNLHDRRRHRHLHEESTGVNQSSKRWQRSCAHIFRHVFVGRRVCRCCDVPRAVTGTARRHGRLYPNNFTCMPWSIRPMRCAVGISTIADSESRKIASRICPMMLTTVGIYESYRAQYRCKCCWGCTL